MVSLILCGTPSLAHETVSDLYRGLLVLQRLQLCSDCVTAFPIFEGLAQGNTNPRVKLSFDKAENCSDVQRPLDRAGRNQGHYFDPQQPTRLGGFCYVVLD
jgi:hypothetical protein